MMLESYVIWKCLIFQIIYFNSIPNVQGVYWPLEKSKSGSKHKIKLQFLVMTGKKLRFFFLLTSSYVITVNISSTIKIRNLQKGKEKQHIMESKL